MAKRYKKIYVKKMMDRWPIDADELIETLNEFKNYENFHVEVEDQAGMGGDCDCRIVVSGYRLENDEEREARLKSERIRRNQAKNAKAEQERMEREQLQKLLEKYPDAV